MKSAIKIISNYPQLVAKTIFGLIGVLSFFGEISAAHAQATFTTNFSTDSWDSDFDRAYQANGTSTSWNSTTQQLSTSGTGTQNTIFNTTATGGSGGSGGSGVGTLDNNTYSGGVLVSAGFEMSPTAGTSIGIWSNMNSAGSSGYLSLLNFTSSTTAELRIFSDTSNPGTNVLGTALATQNFTLSLSASTFYQVALDETVSGSNVTLDLSLLNQAGTSTLATLSYTDSGSADLSGQVGFRLSSTPIILDAIDIQAVPEPPIAVLLLMGMATILFFRAKLSNRLGWSLE